MLIDVKSSLLHISVEYNILLPQQIKYYEAGENQLMNIERHKTILFSEEIVGFFSLLRRWVEKHSQGPFN